MAAKAKTKTGLTYSDYRCTRCTRRLKYHRGRRHWIYSATTGNRYCWPGEGCNR